MSRRLLGAALVALAAFEPLWAGEEVSCRPDVLLTSQSVSLYYDVTATGVLRTPPLLSVTLNNGAAQGDVHGRISYEDANLRHISVPSQDIRSLLERLLRLDFGRFASLPEPRFPIADARRSSFEVTADGCETSVSIQALGARASDDEAARALREVEKSLLGYLAQIQK